MKRILVVASHHTMADGMKDTLEFVSGGEQETVAISAYLDNKPVEQQIEVLMAGFKPDDEVVILTDLASGSVNQKFFVYRNRPHTHIISGMNLPLAFLIAMEPQDAYITQERMTEIVADSKNEIKYVSLLSSEGDEEDE